MRSILIQADARRLPLPDESIQCVATSPPYWGLRKYDAAGEIGLEASPEIYVSEMVAAFREVRRVLRPDGVCWMNLGDCYSNAAVGPRSGGTLNQWKNGGRRNPSEVNDPTSLREAGLKPKNLVGIPWRVAFALQADGWYLRDCIIWHKPNPMPSSVEDRTTTAHEYIFLLTKNARYFYDADAIREPVTSTGGASFGKQKIDATGTGAQSRVLESPAERNHPLGRNKRSVWTIATNSFHGAHFATFPPKLIEPCIKAGTSEKGCCPQCRAPWKRVVDRVRSFESGSGRSGNPIQGKQGPVHGGGETKDLRRGPTTANVTIAWVPTCKCSAGDPVPCRVLDPFSGAATVGVVCQSLGRDYIGTDLKMDYLAMSRQRIDDARNKVPARKRMKREPVEVSLFNGPSFSKGAA